MAQQPTHSNSTPTHEARNRVWEHRLVALLLLAIIGLLGYFHLLGQVDYKLTKEITKRIRQELPSHTIMIDRVHLQSGKSITIEGLRIAKPTDQGLRDVVRIGRLVCMGPIDLVGLAQNQFPVQNVIADGVELCVWPLSNGKWSVQEFASQKPISSLFPNIQVRSGMVRLGSETGGIGHEIICHDFQAAIGLAPRVVQGHLQPVALQINTSLASSYFNKVQASITVSEDKSQWALSGKIQKLEYSKRLVDQLPEVLQAQLTQAAGLSAELDTLVSASGGANGFQFEFKGNIQNGRLLHPLVPYPLESIAGEFYCTNRLVQLRNFQASSGDARLRFACDIQGISVGSPLTANLTINNLALDQRLYQALPANIQEHWSKLGVNGMIDASAAVSYDGKAWKPKVLIRAKDAGVNADFFPYPIKHLQGDFIYENDQIVANSLTAMAGDQTLQGKLTLTKAQPKWLMELIIASEGPIPIDETLMRALTPRGMPQSGFHRFVTSLHPTGTFHLRGGRFARTAEQPDIVSRSLELTFSECSIKYDHFRYPIVDVHGQATLDNNRLILREFVGRNDGARIKSSGVCQVRDSNLESMDLFFDAYDVALDEELQNALPASARNLWGQLQPTGTLDHIAVQLKRTPTQPNLDISVKMLEEHDSNVGKAISFRPESFPYSINEVACSIQYRPGRIDIRSLSGIHDSSRIQTEGQIQLNSDGTWEGLLTWLPSTRFVIDHVLQSCMPATLRDPLVRMNFRGPVNMTGTTRIQSPTPQIASLVREWNLDLEIEEGQFGGDFAKGIRGSVSVIGENTPAGPLAWGALAIDAMAIKNVAVTSLEGPFSIDQNEVLLGREAAAWQVKNNSRLRGNSLALTMRDPMVVPASFRSRVRDMMPERQPGPAIDPNIPRPPSELPRLDIKESDMRARTLSGTLYASAVIPLNGDRVRSKLRLHDADFHGMLVDLGETHTEATGRLSVECDLQSSLTNTTSLSGAGKAWLRDANLYELPFMIRLLGVLYVRPDKGAFDSVDIDFGIDGDRFPVNELQLDGDFLSMRGSGWVNLRRELHFDLSTNASRRGLMGAVGRPFRNRDTTWMQVEVSGTTANPVIQRSKRLMNSLDQPFNEQGK